MADSVTRDGSRTICRVVRLNVSECATVKAVTILKIFTKAGRQSVSTPRHCPASRRNTDGSSSASKTGCDRNQSRYAGRPRAEKTMTLPARFGRAQFKTVAVPWPGVEDGGLGFAVRTPAATCRDAAN